MYSMQNKSIVGVIIVGIMLIAGIYMMTSKAKPAKKTGKYSDYFVGLATKNCSRAQNALDEMIKMDPKEENPLKYTAATGLETVVTYNDLSQYIVKCNTKQLTEHDLKILAKSLERELDNLNMYLPGKY